MSADEPGGLMQAIDVAWGICNQFKTQDAEQAAFAECAPRARCASKL